jgi:hypothetical protein
MATLTFLVVLLDKRYLHEMEGFHKKIPRQKHDSGDEAHQRPHRTDSDQEDVNHPSEATTGTPGAWVGKIPRHKEKGVGGKRHLQRPSRTRENVDLQSEAKMTPGAFPPVDSVNPPYDNDDTFDTVHQRHDRNVTSVSRPVLNAQPSATKIVAHLADDAEIEARIASVVSRQ